MNDKMTVSQLIEKLQKIENQNAVVVVTSSNFELNNSQIPAKSLYQFKGEIKKEGFRDAFDGGSYSTNVVRRDEKGKTDFVEIM